MKKSLQQKVLLVVVILMVFIASGCTTPPGSVATAQKTDAVVQQPTEKPTAQPTVQPTVQQTKAPVEQLGPATYNLYTYYNDENSKKQVDYAVAKVKELIPEISINVIAIDSTDTNLTKMKAFIASDDVPEFYIIKQVYVDAAMASGQLLDLGPYAEKVGYTKNIAPSATGVGKWKGQLIAFPGLTRGFGFIYYNKSVFKDSGIEKAPETWDEFLDAVKKIRAKGYTPISIFGKDQWIYGMLLDIFASRYDPEASLKIASGELKFTDEPYLNAANKIQELAKVGAFSPNVNLMDYPAAEAEFLAGKSAMHLNGAWAFNLYEEKLGKDFGYLFFPANDAAGIEQSKQVWSWGDSGPDGFSLNPKKFKTKAELDRAVQWLYYFAQANADFFAVNGNPITMLTSKLRPEGGLSKNIQQWLIDSGNIKYDMPPLVAVMPVAAGPDFSVAIQKLSTGTYNGADFAKDMQNLLDSLK